MQNLPTCFYLRDFNFQDELDGWIGCDLCEMLFPDETVVRNHKGRVHPGKVFRLFIVYATVVVKWLVS